MARSISPQWRDLIAEFEAFLIASSMAPRTVDLRVNYIERFAQGRTDSPADVEPRDIIKFLGRPGWKPATRSVAQFGVKAFFKWAKKYNHTETDPTAALTPIKQVRAVAAEAATRAQIAEAIRIAPDARSRLIVRLFADAGLSALEMSQARPRDVFERGGDAHIHVFGRRNAERDVYLLPDLAEEVRAVTTEYVFPSRGQGHLDAAYIVRLVGRTLPQGVTSEDLRLAHRTRGGRDSARGWRDGTPHHVPDELTFMENPDLSDSIALQQQIKRISHDIDRDPAASIGACKELLETIFKAVLDDAGVPYGEGNRHETFPELFAMATDALGIPTRGNPGNVDASRGLGNVMDALALLALGVTQTRNDIGTGHGHTASPADVRHSHLVFNSTVALAEFISDTWKATKAL